MPSVSGKQEKFMRAVANSPKFANQVGVPQSVGKEFEMKDMKHDKKMAKGGHAKKMAAGGLSAGHKSADGIATKGKTRGMQPKMAKGGMAKMAKGGKAC
jgi:hypothetical protein